MRSGRLTPSTQRSGTAVSHQPEAQKEHLESETAAENNMHQPVEETTAVPTKKKPSQQAVQPVPLTCWPEVLSELSQTAKPLHGVLDGSAAYEAGNRILIDAPNPLTKPSIGMPCVKPSKTRQGVDMDWALIGGRRIPISRILWPRWRKNWMPLESPWIRNNRPYDERSILFLSRRT